MSKMTKTTKIADRSVARVISALLLIMLLSGSALAGPVRTITFASGSQATIYDADHVLANFIYTENGVSYLDLPGYKVSELLLPASAGGSSVHDQFYPHAIDHVIDALDAVSYPRPVDQIRIVILPYPRKSLTTSSAVEGIMFLSPGVREIPLQATHMITTHELGHLFHFENMPESDQNLWNHWRQIRGVENQAVYSTTAAHRDRPNEIMAEDFRYLFGGEIGNYSGGIENSDLVKPCQVVGLRSFLMGLTQPATLTSEQASFQAMNYPNPFNPATMIAITGQAADLGKPLAVSIYDAQGRLVRHIHQGTLTGARMNFNWNGRDEMGTEQPSGVYFSKISLGDRMITHKMIMVR